MASRLPTLAGLLALVACAGGPAPQPSKPDDLASSTPHRTLQAGGYELRIWYVNRGTRSEGQHGILLRDGEPVPNGRVGELLDTPLGPMRFYGMTTEGMPWEPTGWHFADRTKIEPSWVTEQREKGG